ncbi:2-C-methyl-D-erythritol 4-phosphate cytidylyltransferase [Gleimia coleocanis DSM 15436]|uniref:2-C-methyl-D-erythritol 4-phosphate cytidylyltransferase n=1 Tax=Gleimia coleocanis DSM 15436 TaxID=525245 RepID=C0W224_9ACTO|nr:2-C-methyl-D-erythritol 4-phosphate cytidylyltransferase [Gleimia coleocanis]EEH63238.1 2-C-methyl-D-erythritol 4-phosphate cytidylyltransferase [Gleimia coleocanis DSM 15436]
MGKRVYAVITAAGTGTRLGYNQPKALVPLGDKTIVEHAVERFLAHPRVAGVVVTALDDGHYFADFQKILEGDARILVVPGGGSRQESVYRGLQAVPGLAQQLEQDFVSAETLVLIHDAARCLTPVEVVERVVMGLESEAKAVIPALPVVDTLSEFKVLETEGLEFSGETVDRAKLRAVQTPQGFHYDVIMEGHALGKEKSTEEEFTDDASLMRLTGEPVLMVRGSELSLKVTTPFDLRVAAALLADQGV